MKHINQSDFQSHVLDYKGTSLVDFYASWCGPCKMISPVMEDLDKELGSNTVQVVKVDVDANPNLAASYGVMSIPTVVVFKDGKEVNRLLGAQSEETYKKALTSA